MAVTGKDLEKYYIKKITLQDIKCQCEDKNKVLEALNIAIDKINNEISQIALRNDKIVKEITDIKTNLSDKIKKIYPDMELIFMKTGVDIELEIRETLLNPYVKEILESFKAQIKTWISSSSKGVTPEIINDAVKYCEKIQKGRIYECVKTLENKSDELMNRIIGTYQKNFNKIINRKLSQVQTRLKIEIKPLQNWVPVWNPAGDFSNLLNALKELLKVTKSGKGKLCQGQIPFLDDLLQEPTRTHGNTRGYMQTISTDSPPIKEITDLETKRIVVSYMSMLTEDSTQRQHFTESYIERKFRLTIKSNQEVLKKLIQQLTSVIENSIDTSVATNLKNLCDSITRLIDIISPQPMKGKLDQNDITLIKQLILCTYKNYKFTNKIPEINLLCVEDMPTKCLMLDIIKLVEKNMLNDSNLQSIAKNYLESKNSITQKDLKIGIFNMPSTKKKLVEDINQQIKRFDEFIKEQKARRKEIENYVKEPDLYDYLCVDKIRKKSFFQKVEDNLSKKSNECLKEVVIELRTTFKTDYLNKWTKNKKAFETDCVINNDGVCKWEQELIDVFESKFKHLVISSWYKELEEAATREFISLVKYANDHIKPYENLCLNMFDVFVNNVSPTTYRNERPFVSNFLKWIKKQATSNSKVNLSSTEKKENREKYKECICCFLLGNDDIDDDISEKLDSTDDICYFLTRNTHNSIYIISSMLILKEQISSNPEPKYHVKFKEKCAIINKNLSRNLENIKNNQTTCQTWKNYEKNEKFKKLFNGFINALEKDEPISSDIANLMEFFINDGFNVKNDYNVPEFISKSWNHKNTRRIILGIRQLYPKSGGGSQAILESLAKNIDANAGKNREELEKFLGIDKSKTQEEQEQPRKQPSPNKSTAQKPKQAPAAKPKNKGSGTFNPRTNGTPVAARKKKR